MKDPLTDKEKDKFFKVFRKEFDTVYEKLLNSGALSEEDTEPHDHLLAKCVFVITASHFMPLSPYGKKLLSELEKI